MIRLNGSCQCIRDQHELRYLIKREQTYLFPLSDFIPKHSFPHRLKPKYRIFPSIRFGDHLQLHLTQR